MNVLFMVEAEDVLREYFTKNELFVWELHRDPDGGQPEMWLKVKTRLSVKEARDRLDLFDESYWLAVCNKRGFSVGIDHIK